MRLISPTQKLFLTLCFAALLVINPACRTNTVRTQPASQISEQREIVDDLGRRVRVPVRIERVVSLAPNLTENVFAVGAGDKLVGVTSYCNYPAEAQTIAKVGDTLNPSLERIIALRPQLVLATTASQLETFTTRMTEQNVAVFVTDPKDLNGVFRNLEQMGELLGTADTAEKLVAELQTRVHEVEEKVAARERVSTFVQIAREPLFTVGRNSFITDVLRRAGGASVTDDVDEAFPRISDEIVLAARPTVIFLSANDSMDAGNNAPADALRSSPAVQNNRVYPINGDLITRPSPRLVDALEEMARRLHPEVFEN